MSGAPLHSRIWREEPEADNPFAARAAYCHGYDVFGQMLGRATWVDMLHLLFKGEAPDPTQARLLETLAVALANPGPRDPMVHAAMCGGIGGSPAAASLMAALSTGAGQSGGARDVFLAMRAWADCDADRSLATASRIARLTSLNKPEWPGLDDFGWPDPDHPPGFEPHGVRTSGIVLQTLQTLAAIGAGPRLAWLLDHRTALEAAGGLPLGMSGVAAAAFMDLNFAPKAGEMLYLLLRLPGAAAHALEQQDYGFKRFPYPDVQLEDDPAMEQTP